MTTAAAYRRWSAGAGLGLTAILMALAMGTDVPFSGDGGEVLAGMADAGNRAWISAFAYLFAQLAMIAGALGLAHLLRAKAPTLSNVGATLAVLGDFGHTAHGGAVLLTIQMAADPTHRSTHANVLSDSVASPAGVFSAIGLVGTVLVLIVLVVGIWRVGLGPRWVAPALGAFMLLEFLGSAISPVVGVVAGALNLLAFFALTVTIWRSPIEAWQLPPQEAPVSSTPWSRSLDEAHP